MLLSLFVYLRNTIIAFAYKYALKPILFLIDPEQIHDFFIRCGVLLGRFSLIQKITSLFFGYRHSVLTQTIAGISFANPIGLAAGFDKNAQLLSILPSVGFGYVEVGSATGRPCDGNPKPRLWRVPESKSLLVYYGLKNDGALAVAQRVDACDSKIPVGISIAKTNAPDTVELDSAIRDYVRAYTDSVEVADYVTINISCPNAYGGQPFTNPSDFKKLISALHTIDGFSKPVFIKLSPDISSTSAYALVRIGLRYGITGVICSNLTKKRSNPSIPAGYPEHGGFSGKLVEPLANDMIRYLRKRFGASLVIIGCGGVFNAEDAYQKIRSGASMIQLITGMIYNGPQVISTINVGLSRRLKRDGFSHISEAVGVDA